METRSVLRGADEHAQRRRHGGRADVRLCGGAARRENGRFHDRGVRGDTVCSAADGDEPDHQRSAGGEPGAV